MSFADKLKIQVQEDHDKRIKENEIFLQKSKEYEENKLNECVNIIEKTLLSGMFSIDSDIISLGETPLSCLGFNKSFKDEKISNLLIEKKILPEGSIVKNEIEYERTIEGWDYIDVIKIKIPID